MAELKIQFHKGEWTRPEAEVDVRTLYIFTDNTDRTSGRGTVSLKSRYAKKYGAGLCYPTKTAAVVRGLDNAYPVSSQRWYHQGATGEAGRWNDTDFDAFKAVVDDEFAEIAQAWKSGRYDRVMLPSGGGFVNRRISAITRERTPKLYAYLQEKTTELFKIISPEEAEAMENRDAIDNDCVYVNYVRGSNMPDNAYTVRIFAGNRQGIVTDTQIPVLYPQFATMSGPHKDGKIDDAEYTRRYESQILRPNEKAILSEVARVKAEATAQGKVPVLLCYCRPGEYCHRYLVSNWLNEHGVASREVPGDRRMYEKGHVILFGEEGATVIGRQAPEEQAQPEVINIYAGAGEHAELSNFAIHPFRYAFKTRTSEIGPFNFKSVEQAYQYAKTLYSTADKEVLGQLRGRILNTTDGGELRKLGRSIPSLLSEAWEKNSPAIMKNLLLTVYRDNPGARKALLDTGNATLTHTQDNGRWGELFPRLLMEVRDTVRNEMLEKGYVENPAPVIGSIEDEAFKLAGYIERGRGPKSWKDTFVRVWNYSPKFWEILKDIDTNSEHPLEKLSAEERAGIASSLRAKGKQAMQEERRRMIMTVQSGGARGADEAFGLAATAAGGTVNHWYAGERTENNAPLGNREMSAEDFEEGKTEAAAAARRNWGYEYSSMKDVRLVRDWAQVKYADAVIAVAHIARPGEPVFPSQKRDSRTAIVPCVTGGTGYAVGMAILHDKPVYVFDQVDGHWYNWDKEKEDFIQVEKPEYYNNFAGIGSRELTDAGREAINAYVEGVRATLSNSMKEEAQEKKEEQIEVEFNQEKKNGMEQNVDNAKILEHYVSYEVLVPGVNLAVDTSMDKSREWFEIVDDNGERLVRAANYVQELREYDSAHFENPVVSPDGSVTLDAVAHIVSPEGEVETSEITHPVKFSAEELKELVVERKNRNIENKQGLVSKTITARRLATDTAMFLADKLNGIGIRTEVVSQEQARGVLHENPDGAEFSVADIQKLNYEWNGEQISMKVFAQTFGDLIKQKDRTMEDVERIAKAYIDSVKENPAAFIPQLKAENMSHWRYFVLPDGSVYSPQHLMANSPEYQTQRGLYEIYRDVLGDRLPSFMDSVSRYNLLSEAERNAFLEMERDVSGSDLMQRTLETNAEKVNERRNKDISNLIQYFNENTDYTSAEKALILKGAMTYSYSEKKKDGGRNEVKLVRITDANDVSVPVLGGEAATIAEGLRKGLNFKDSLILARNSVDDSRSRSVARDFSGWKVYEKSDREEDAVILQKDAAGTGWCTGGAVSTARTHLSGGDFHIYFDNGEPLIAIRTENGRLAEAPRGAHEGQFCTPREEEITFAYIQEGHGIAGGKGYVADMQDLRKLNSPDCTWRDVVKIPNKRRYENGEFGGNTRSWGEAAEAKIRQIMTDSREERFAAGYYTPQEIVEHNIPRQQVRGLLNDESFGLNGDWPNLEFIKGDIYINDNVELPKCESIEGNVRVWENGTFEAPECESIGGSVEVKENGTFKAPECESIGGSVYIKANGTFTTPEIKSIGGDVVVSKNGTFEAPEIKSIGRGVWVWENGTFKAPECESIGGYVDVGENGTFTAPKCESIEGEVIIRKNGTFKAPECKSIKGYVDVSKNGTFEAPEIKSIGGSVEVWENGTFEAPECESIEGNVIVKENGTFDAPECKSIGRSVIVCKNGTFEAPSLQNVERFQADTTAKITVPASVWTPEQNFHLSDGTVYGYERGNTIYLTPEGINPNTPIHEYAHLWAKAMQKTNPEQWNGIKETLKTLPEWNGIAGREDYAFLRNDEDRLAGEVLATVVGDRAEEMLVRTAGEALAEGQEITEDIIRRLNQAIGRYVTEDLFELKEHTQLNVGTLTLGVMKSLVEQKDIVRMMNNIETKNNRNMKEDYFSRKESGYYDKKQAKMKPADPREQLRELLRNTIGMPEENIDLSGYTEIDVHASDTRHYVVCGVYYDAGKKDYVLTAYRDYPYEDDIPVIREITVKDMDIEDVETLLKSDIGLQMRNVEDSVEKVAGESKESAQAEEIKDKYPKSLNDLYAGILDTVGAKENDAEKRVNAFVQALNTALNMDYPVEAIESWALDVIADTEGSDIHDDLEQAYSTIFFSSAEQKAEQMTKAMETGDYNSFERIMRLVDFGKETGADHTIGDVLGRVNEMTAGKSEDERKAVESRIIEWRKVYDKTRVNLVAENGAFRLAGAVATEMVEGTGAFSPEELRHMYGPMTGDDVKELRVGILAALKNKELKEETGEGINAAMMKVLDEWMAAQKVVSKDEREEFAASLDSMYEFYRENGDTPSEAADYAVGAYLISHKESDCRKALKVFLSRPEPASELTPLDTLNIYRRHFVPASATDRHRDVLALLAAGMDRASHTQGDTPDAEFVQGCCDAFVDKAFEKGFTPSEVWRAAAFTPFESQINDRMDEVTPIRSIAEEIVRGDGEFDREALKEFCSGLTFDDLHRMKERVIALVLKENSGLTLNQRGETERDAVRQFNEFTGYREDKAAQLESYGILTYDKYEAGDIDSFNTIQDNDVIVYASDREGISPGPVVNARRHHEHVAVATFDYAKMREMGIYPRSQFEAENDIWSEENANVEAMREKVLAERNNTRKTFELSMSYDEVYSNIRDVFATAKDNPEKIYRLMFKENLAGSDKGFWLGLDYLKMCIRAKEEVFGEEPARNIRVPYSWAEDGYFKGREIKNVPEKVVEEKAVEKEKQAEGFSDRGPSLKETIDLAKREVYDFVELLGGSGYESAVLPVPCPVEVENGDVLVRANIVRVEAEGDDVRIIGHVDNGVDGQTEALFDATDISLPSLKKLWSACAEAVAVMDNEKAGENIVTMNKATALKEKIQEGPVAVPEGAVVEMNGNTFPLEGVSVEDGELTFKMRNTSLTGEDIERLRATERMSLLKSSIRRGGLVTDGITVTLDGRAYPLVGAAVDKSGDVILSYKNTALSNEEKRMVLLVHKETAVTAQAREGSVIIPADTFIGEGEERKRLLALSADINGSPVVAYEVLSETAEKYHNAEYRHRFAKLQREIRNSALETRLPDGATVTVNKEKFPIVSMVQDGEGRLLFSWKDGEELKTLPYEELGYDAVQGLLKPLGLKKKNAGTSRQVINALVSGVDVAAPDGAVISVGGGECRLTGFTIDEYGTPVAHWIPEGLTEEDMDDLGLDELSVADARFLVDRFGTEPDEGWAEAAGVSGVKRSVPAGTLSVEERESVVAVVERENIKTLLKRVVYAESVLPVPGEGVVKLSGSNVRLGNIFLDVNGRLMVTTHAISDNETMFSELKKTDREQIFSVYGLDAEKAKESDLIALIYANTVVSLPEGTVASVNGGQTEVKSMSIGEGGALMLGAADGAMINSDTLEMKAFTDFCAGQGISVDDGWKPETAAVSMASLDAGNRAALLDAFGIKPGEDFHPEMETVKASRLGYDALGKTLSSFNIEIPDEEKKAQRAEQADKAFRTINERFELKVEKDRIYFYDNVAGKAVHEGSLERIPAFFYDRIRRSKEDGGYIIGHLVDANGVRMPFRFNPSAKEPRFSVISPRERIAPRVPLISSETAFQGIFVQSDVRKYSTVAKAEDGNLDKNIHDADVVLNIVVGESTPDLSLARDIAGASELENVLSAIPAAGVACEGRGKMFEIRLDPARLSGTGYPYTLKEITELSRRFAEFLKNKPDANVFVTGTGYGALKKMGFDTLAHRMRDNYSENGDLVNKNASEVMLMRVISNLLMISADKERKYLGETEPANIAAVISAGCPGDIGEYALHAALRNGFPAGVSAAAGYPVYNPETGEKTLSNDFNAYRSCYVNREGVDLELLKAVNRRKKNNGKDKNKDKDEVLHVFTTNYPENDERKHIVIEAGELYVMDSLKFDTLKFPAGTVITFEGQDKPMKVAGLSVFDVVDRLKLSAGYPAKGSPLYDETIFMEGPNGKTLLKPGVTNEQYKQYMYDNAIYPVFSACLEKRADLRSKLSSAITSYLTRMTAHDAGIVVLQGDECCKALCDFLNGGNSEAVVDKETGEVKRQGRFVVTHEEADQNDRPDIGFEINGRAGVMGIHSITRQEIVGRFPLNAATVIKLSPNSTSNEYVRKNEFEAAMKEAGVTRPVEYPVLKKLSVEEKANLYDSYAARIRGGENIVFVTNGSNPEYARETGTVLQELASRGVDLRWITAGKKGTEIISQEEVIEAKLLKEDKILMQGRSCDVRFDADGKAVETDAVRYYVNRNARAIFGDGEMKNPNYGKNADVVVGRHKAAHVNVRDIAAEVDIMLCFGGSVSADAFGKNKPRNVIMVDDILDRAGKNAFSGKNPEWFLNEENAMKVAAAVKNKMMEICAANPGIDASSLTVGFDGITSAELAYKGFGDSGAPDSAELDPYKENKVDISRIEKEVDELKDVTNDDLREQYGMSSRNERDKGKAFSHSEIREDTSDLPVTEFSTLTQSTPLFDFMKTVWKEIGGITAEDNIRIAEGFEEAKDVQKRTMKISRLVFSPDFGFNQEACNAFMADREEVGDKDYRVVAHPTKNAALTYFDGTPTGRRVGAGDRVEEGRHPMTLDNALARQEAMRRQGLYSKVSDETLRRKAELSRLNYYASESSEETPGLSGRQMLTLMMAGVSSGDIMTISNAAEKTVIPDWETLSDMLRSYSALDIRKKELQEERDKAFEALNKQKDFSAEYLKNRPVFMEAMKAVAEDKELKDYASQKKALQAALKERGVRFHKELEKALDGKVNKHMTVTAAEGALAAFDNIVAGHIDTKTDAYRKAVEILNIHDAQSRNFFTAGQLEHFAEKADRLVDENAAKGLSFCSMNEAVYPFSKRIFESMKEAGLEFSFDEKGVFSVRSTGDGAVKEPLFDKDGKLIEEPKEDDVTKLFTRGAALVSTLDAIDPCFFYEGDLGKIQATPRMSLFSSMDSTERDLSFARNVLAGTLADKGITPVVSVEEPLIGQGLRTHGNVERSEGDFRKNAAVETARTMIEDDNSHAVLISQTSREDSMNSELLKKNAANGGVNIYPAEETAKNGRGKDKKRSKNEKDPNFGMKLAGAATDVSTIVSDATSGLVFDPISPFVNSAVVAIVGGTLTAEKIAEIRRRHEKKNGGKKNSEIRQMDKTRESVEALADKVRELGGFVDEKTETKREEEIRFPNFEKMDVLRHGSAIHVFVNGNHPDVLRTVRERFEGEAIIHDISRDPDAVKRVENELRSGSVFVDSPISSDGAERFDFYDGHYLDVGMEELQPRVSKETLFFVKGSLYDITDVPAEAFPDWNLLEDNARKQLLSRADDFFRTMETGWKETLSELGITTDVHSSDVHMVIDRAGRDLKVMDGNDVMLHVRMDGTGHIRLDQAGKLIDDAGDENEHAIIDDRISSLRNGNVRIDDFDKLGDEILNSVRGYFSAPREEEALKEKNDRSEGDLRKKREDGLTVLEKGLERSHLVMDGLRKSVDEFTARIKEIEKNLKSKEPRFTEKELAVARESLRLFNEKLSLYASHRVLYDRNAYAAEVDRILVYAMADKACKTYLSKENALAKKIASLEKKIAKITELADKYTIVESDDSYEKICHDKKELEDMLNSLKPQWRAVVLQRLHSEMVRDRIGSAEVIGVKGKIADKGMFDVCVDNMVFSVKGCKVKEEDIEAARTAIEELRNRKKMDEAVASTPLRAKVEVTTEEDKAIAGLRAEAAALEEKIAEKDKQIEGFRQAESKIDNKEGKVQLLRDMAKLEGEKEALQKEKEGKQKQIRDSLLKSRSKDAFREKEHPFYDINSADARHYGGLVCVPVGGKFKLVTEDCKPVSRDAERIEPISDGCWYIEYDKKHKNIIGKDGHSLLPVDVDSVFASPSRDVNEHVVRVCKDGMYNYVNTETGKVLLVDPVTGAYAGTSCGKPFVNGWASVNARESDGDIAFVKDGNGNFLLAKKDADGKPLMQNGEYVLAQKGEEGVRIPKVNLIDEDGHCLSPGVWFDSVNVVRNEAAAEDAKTLAGYIRAVSGPKDWRELFKKVCGYDHKSAEILSPIDPDKSHCISNLSEDVRMKIASSLENHADALGKQTFIRFACADPQGKMIGGGIYESTNKFVRSENIKWFVESRKLSESIETGFKLKTSK